MNIGEMARQLATMLIPFLPLLSKLGEKATEDAGKKMGGDAWEKIKLLWSKLQPRSETKPTVQEAIKDATQNPKDEDVQAALRLQFKKLLTEDNSLALEIEPLIKEIQQTNIVVTAIGDRNVVISGGVSGSTIITGDDGK